MRTEDEIRAALEQLERQRETLKDDYNCFVDLQGNPHLRDERVGIEQAATYVDEQVRRLRAVSKTIMILRWSLGEIEHLPWY